MVPVCSLSGGKYNTDLDSTEFSPHGGLSLDALASHIP